MLPLISPAIFYFATPVGSIGSIFGSNTPFVIPIFRPFRQWPVHEKPYFMGLSNIGQQAATPIKHIRNAQAVGSNPTTSSRKGITRKDLRVIPFNSLEDFR